MQTRVDILRAAFILKRTIGVELLDPKPYILNDITAVNIEWLSELLELAEWTRTSGYIKQSQQMKNRLIDCCLELDYTSLSESTIQLILYKLWPLAHNYNRQDAVEVMNPLWDFRREFYADLITSTHLDTAEKRKIVRRMADEYLDEICSTYHAKAHNKIADVLEDSEHTNDYKRLRAIFIEHYEHIKELFDQGYNRWVDMCLHVTAQEKGDQYFHPFVFVEHCEKRLSHLISEDQYAFVYNQDEIEGLMYYVFEKADIKVLSSEAEDFILDLSEEAGYQPEHIAKIIENIHRIRPETKEFLAIE
jgi:hypothetical protein